MTALRILSPSQLSTVTTESCGDGCYRNWGFKYLAKLQEPENVYAEEGKECARRLEKYYLTGERPVNDKLGRVVNAAFTKLPPRDRHVRSEHPIYEIPFAGGVFGGRRVGRECKMDVYDPIRESGFAIGPAAAAWSLDEPLICDLKTTTDLKNAKTEAQLRKDVQVNLYVKAALIDTGAPAAQCRWLYVTRDKENPRLHPVDFRITKEEVAEFEKACEDTVGRVLSLYQLQPDANSIPPNLTACKKFRGCAFGLTKLNVCQLTDSQKVTSLMNSPINDTKAQVDAMLKLGSNPAAVASKPSVPAFSFKPAGTPSAPPPSYRPHDFELPLGDGGLQVPEEMRAPFLKWALETRTNPLSHLNATPDEAFMNAALEIVAKLDATLAAAQAAVEAAALPPPTDPVPPPDPYYANERVEEEDAGIERKRRPGRPRKELENGGVSITINAGAEFAERLLAVLEKLGARS